jgi:hypothetical protein
VTNCAKKAGLVATGAVGMLALGVGVYLLVHREASRGGERASTKAKPNFPDLGPAEFLYLDSTRTDSYIAQIDGGSQEAENLSRKIKDSLSATLGAAKVVEAGVSEDEEEGEESEVRPTQASRFFALRTALGEAGDLNHPLAQAAQEKAEPSEGEFVEFSLPELFTPAYLRPYVVSRGTAALRAAFAKHRRRRGARERFLRGLGSEPRAMLAVRPKGKGVYLLPVEAQLLSSERSLLEGGGGSFTVVGKVVRSFPPRKDGSEPQYKDFAAREEWRPALEEAPGRLICRSSARCAKAQRAEPGRREPERQLKAARRRDLRALGHDTVIGNHGAVILPVAIYK